MHIAYWASLWGVISCEMGGLLLHYLSPNWLEGKFELKLWRYTSILLTLHRLMHHTGMPLLHWQSLREPLVAHASTVAPCGL